MRIHIATDHAGLDFSTHLQEHLAAAGHEVIDHGPSGLPPTRMSPREAFFSPHETVSVKDAIGRISTEIIAPYPPGIPVLVPGEEITKRTIEELRAARRAGVRIAYAADSTLETFQVVAGTSRRRGPGRRR